jgi:serine/threonine protein kinase
VGTCSRDLKPKVHLNRQRSHGYHKINRSMCQNILLDADGVVKLSDFGVAKELQHTSEAAQTVIGTPFYM